MSSSPKRFNLKAFALFILIDAILLGSGIAGYVWANSAQNSAKDVPKELQSKPYYPVNISTKDGAYLIQAELADTPETLALGLMGRTALARDHGMFFLFPEERDVFFWMRNTLIPLDLIYIAKDGVINHIHPMAQPLDETPLPSKGGKVIAVLEIAGGQAAAKNIQIGDKIKTPLLERTRP